MTFSPRIVEVSPLSIQKGITHRPMISGMPQNGMVLVYADWCPFCQMVKPWYNQFAEQTPEDVFVGVIQSDDVQDIFEPEEVSGYPCFKKVSNGRIERPELHIDRSNEGAAIGSMFRALGLRSAESPSLVDLESRVLQLDDHDAHAEEVKHLRAQLAKATMIANQYDMIVQELTQRLETCEGKKGKTAASAPSKKKTDKVASPSPKAKVVKSPEPPKSKRVSRRKSTSKSPTSKSRRR